METNEVLMADDAKSVAGEPVDVNKNLSAKIQTSETMSTSPHPDYLAKGPLVTEQMFNQADWPRILGPSPSSRPVRSTRNPSPKYVDSVKC